MNLLAFRLGAPTNIGAENSIILSAKITKVPVFSIGEIFPSCNTSFTGSAYDSPDFIISWLKAFKAIERASAAYCPAFTVIVSGNV